MSAAARGNATKRGDPSRRRPYRWASLWRRQYLGKNKVWKCTFCGVIGSHRRGCHYVTQAHHRPAKPVRRGALGSRARAKKAMPS
jgi:hypothetical protein